MVHECQEARLAGHDPLSGEPLLVIGSQLAEFAEDKDRLDVLALDKSGEIVLPNPPDLTRSDRRLMPTRARRGWSAQSPRG